MRVVEEQLPKAAAHALEGEPAQLVFDAGLSDLRGGSRQFGRRKAHVVADPGAHLVQLLPVDDMQDRLVTDIEPVAGELEIRPRADLEAEEVAVELLSLFEVVAQHREVVHPLNAHAHLSFARAARLRRAQGMDPQQPDLSEIEMADGRLCVNRSPCPAAACYGKAGAKAGRDRVAR